MSELVKSLNDIFKIAEIKEHRITASIISQAIDEIKLQQERVEVLEKEIENQKAMKVKAREQRDSITAVFSELKCALLGGNFHAFKSIVEKRPMGTLKIRDLEQQSKGVEDAIAFFHPAKDLDVEALRGYAEQLRQKAKELSDGSGPDR